MDPNITPKKHSLTKSDELAIFVLQNRCLTHECCSRYSVFYRSKMIKDWSSNLLTMINFLNSSGLRNSLMVYNPFQSFVDFRKRQLLEPYYKIFDCNEQQPPPPKITFSEEIKRSPTDTTITVPPHFSNMVGVFGPNCENVHLLALVDTWMCERLSESNGNYSDFSYYTTTSEHSELPYLAVFHFLSRYTFKQNKNTKKWFLLKSFGGKFILYTHGKIHKEMVERSSCMITKKRIVSNSQKNDIISNFLFSLCSSLYIKGSTPLQDKCEDIDRNIERKLCGEGGIVRKLKNLPVDFSGKNLAGSGFKLTGDSFTEYLKRDLLVMLRAISSHTHKDGEKRQFY